MPMIDGYAAEGTFDDEHALANKLAETLMKIEGVPAIPMFKNNTAGFVHELPAEAISNVNGDSNYVRVQVLTNAGALNRDQQLAVVEQFTNIIVEAAGDNGLSERTWVLLTEAVPGGLGSLGPRPHQRGTRGRRPRTDRRASGLNRSLTLRDRRAPTGAGARRI